MSITTKINNTLRNINNIYTKVNDDIRQITCIYENVNGDIKPIYKKGEYFLFRWRDFDGVSTNDKYNLKYLGQFTLENPTNVKVSILNMDTLKSPTDGMGLDIVDTVIISSDKSDYMNGNLVNFRCRWTNNYRSFINSDFKDCQDKVIAFDNTYNNTVCVYDKSINIGGTYHVYAGKFAVKSSGKTRHTLNELPVDTKDYDGIGYQYPLYWYPNSDLSFKIKIEFEST